MDYGVDAVFFENLIEGGSVRGFAHDQLGWDWDRGWVTVAQIVEHDYFRALFKELAGDYASDVSGASGD
jgi:hypothetical protein